MASFDLVIEGGTVVDGTGAAARPGNVGIRQGRIAAVGDARGDAVRTIDARGAVVAPGFIDIHTHYDAQIFWDRMLTPSSWHGVTSVVMGNCGFGVAPTRPNHRDLILRTLENVEGMSLAALRAGVGEQWPFETFPQYLDAIEARGTMLNVGVLLGHTPLRTYVMGEEAVSREATPDEIEAMRRIVLEALEAGALGFASSKAAPHVGYDGHPVPSRIASIDEIRALAGALKGFSHSVMQATFGPGLTPEEFARIHRETGRPVTWTALLADPMPEAMVRGLLEKHEAMQAEGIRVFPQVACRPVMIEFQFKAPFPLQSMSVMTPVNQTDVEGRKALYADPGFRKALREKIDSSRMRDRFRQMAISGYDPDPSLLERSLGEVAAERGVHPVDLALDLSLQTGLEARFRMAAANSDEALVGELLAHPATILGLSDAGAHASQLCDAGAPTTLLGKWVREKGTISLEEGVRQLTSQPADVFGISDRGRLAPGLAADVTIFDPATVGCEPVRRVFDFPAGADRLVADSTGIRTVIVNGTVVREEGRDAIASGGALPGRLLRGGRAG